MNDEAIKLGPVAVTGPWEDVLERLVGEASSVCISTPFISKDAAQVIGRSWKGHKLSILTTLNAKNLVKGSLDVEALAVLSALPGAEVRNISRNHANIFIFDDKKILITSSNLTSNGLGRNMEAGVILQDESSREEWLREWRERWQGGQRIPAPYIQKRLRKMVENARAHLKTVNVDPRAEVIRKTRKKLYPLLRPNRKVRSRSREEVELKQADLPLKKVDFPQADRADLVMEVPLWVKSGADNAEKLAQSLKRSVRQAQYYARAAELLGLIRTRGGKYMLTERGQSYNSWGRDVHDVFRSVCLNAPFMRKLAIDLGVDLRELGPDSHLAKAFSKKEDVAKAIARISPHLSGATLKRRAHTIALWTTFITSPQQYRPRNFVRQTSFLDTSLKAIEAVERRQEIEAEQPEFDFGEMTSGRKRTP